MSRTLPHGSTALPLAVLFLLGSAGSPLAVPACVEAEGRRQATGVPREAMAPEAEPLRPGRASRAAQPTSGDEGESGTLPDVGQGAAENVLVPQSLPTLVVDSAPIQPPGRYLPHFLPFALAPPAHPRS